MIFQAVNEHTRSCSELDGAINFANKSPGAGPLPAPPPKSTCVANAWWRQLLNPVPYKHNVYGCKQFVFSLSSYSF